VRRGAPLTRAGPGRHPSSSVGAREKPPGPTGGRVQGRCPDGAVRKTSGAPAGQRRARRLPVALSCVRAQPRPAARERSGKGEPAGSAAGAAAP
jgi:hypothetical protein